MNGAQDLGGAMGFGPINPEKDEPYFHADWEKRALALTLAMGATGEWNIDVSRHARETLHPADYLAKSYYDIWVSALEKLMVARDLATQGEIASGAMATPPKAVKRVLRGADVPAVLARGGPCDRPAARAAKFKVGDQVRTIIEHTTRHTRLPRYARGKIGVIERAHGAYVYPDANAHGEGEQPHWLYTVRFSAAELWGRDGDPNAFMSIDAWEPYLESA